MVSTDSTNRMTVGEAISKRLFDIANNVAIEFASKLCWSDFYPRHIAQRKTHPDGTLDLTEYAQELKRDPFKFYGDCVLHAHLTSEELRKRLGKTLGLEKYAGQVKLLAGRCCNDGFPFSADSLKRSEDKEGRHCVCALELDGSIIVIDLSFHPTAIKLAVGGAADKFDCLEATGIMGQSLLARFLYLDVYKDDRKPELFEMRGFPTPDHQDTQGYRDMDFMIYGGFKETSYEKAVELITSGTRVKVYLAGGTRSSQ